LISSQLYFHFFPLVQFAQRLKSVANNRWWVEWIRLKRCGPNKSAGCRAFGSEKLIRKEVCAIERKRGEAQER